MEQNQFTILLYIIQAHLSLTNENAKYVNEI
jgi:hypothetical protein